ncbi:MAG: exopolyphosphatase [Proteobacteria bacterium]|nr:MAG: exopolyphosphatase [Pseudomonadota bacterium]
MADNTLLDQGMSGQTLAAVDLGSNSFHMIISRIDASGKPTLIDKEKEMIRLRGGLDEQGNLDPDYEARALACLKRFGDRLRHFESRNVRIAGTNTLRRMQNSDDFIRKGSQLLGHPIEIISGREEARLVYLGVSHSLSCDQRKQLVIDIGGGSTEFIIGRDFIPETLESLDVGAASSTQRFFAMGDLSATAWERADVAIRLEILPIQQAFERGNWSRAIGSSGTIKTTLSILQALGYESFCITLDALYKLRDLMITAGHLTKLSLPGLSEDRQPVYAGGLAVLIAVFESLNIDEMIVSEGALREGLLYDMLGRICHEDVRDRSIEEMMGRFQIDFPHAERVQKTALVLFDQVAEKWSLPKKERALLSWAAQLHEIGLLITHNKHHYQGAYILKYAFMPGFSRREQVWISTLVKTHRRKIRDAQFEDIPEHDRETLIRMSILLRLSVLLHRRRDSRDLSPKLQVEDHRIQLISEKGLAERELLEADLKREQAWLEKVNYDLCYQ